MKTTVKRTLSLLLAAAKHGHRPDGLRQQGHPPQPILPQIRRQPLHRLMLPI